jgi:hypothetical protein
MKNKKSAIIILLLFAIQLFIDIFYDNKILSKSLLYLAFILTALNFTKLNIKKDYILFVIGIFCYLAAVLTRISTNSSFIFLSMFLTIMGMGIHFWLYYMNKEN